MTSGSANTLTIVGTILIFAGCFAVIAGIVVLISSVFQNRHKNSKQAARLSAKGFTDEISGALGNASFDQRIKYDDNDGQRNRNGIGLGRHLLTIGSYILLTQIP